MHKYVDYNIVNCNSSTKLSQIDVYNYCILDTIIVNIKICGTFDKVYKTIVSADTIVV